MLDHCNLTIKETGFFFMAWWGQTQQWQDGLTGLLHGFACQVHAVADRGHFSALTQRQCKGIWPLKTKGTELWHYKNGRVFKLNYIFNASLKCIYFVWSHVYINWEFLMLPSTQPVTCPHAGSFTNVGYHRLISVITKPPQPPPPFYHVLHWLTLSPLGFPAF